MARRFSEAEAKAIGRIKYMPIRSGAAHRFVPVWVVVGEGRVLVRSWNNKPDGWFAAFLDEPRGSIQVDGRDVPVRATRVRSERLNAAASEAYAAKYTTKANAKYVEGFAAGARVKNTLELLPRAAPGDR